MQKLLNKASIFGFMCSILILIIFALIPQAALAQNGVTSVKIDLDQASQDAHVDSEAGLLVFTGKVTVITTSSSDINVRLQGEIEKMEHYAIEFDPKSITFKQSDQEDFKVEITVPQGTLAGNYKLLIEAISFHEGEPDPNEPSDTAEAHINVVEYHYLKIGSQEPYQELEGGGTTDYYVDIENMGNTKETVDFDKDLPFGWLLQSDLLKFQLEPNEVKPLKFTIITPPTPNLGHYYLNTNFTVSGLNFPYTIHAYVENDHEIIIAGGDLSVLILTAGDLNLGTIKPGDVKNIELTVRCYVKTTQVEIDYELLEIGNENFLTDDYFEIELSPTRKYITEGSSATFNLKLKLNSSKELDRKLEFNELIRVQATSTESSSVAGLEVTPQSNKISLNFIVVDAGDKHTTQPFYTTTTGVIVTSSIILAGALGAVAGGTEFGKYRALCILFVPLYTKIHKDKVLDHFTRGRVYEYIRNNPGSHYSLIKRELSLNNGGLTYHLRTLEREELIRSRRVGIYKLFYTTKAQVPETIGLGLTKLQKAIVEAISKNPGISQTEIGAKIEGKSQRTVSHHIKTMARKGLIVLEKDGRETKCYLADNYEEVISDAVEIKPTRDLQSEEGIELKSTDRDSVLKKI